MYIFLASTTRQYLLSASHVLNTQPAVVGKHRDSDYESDPVPTGCKHDVLSGDVVYKCYTEVLNNTACFSGCQKRVFQAVEKQLGT